MANLGKLSVLLLMVASGSSSPRVKQINLAETSNIITWKENVTDYPEMVAEWLLHTLESQNLTKYFLNTEQIIKMKRHKAHEENYNNNTTYRNLCVSYKQRIFPRSVVINDEQYFVLNPKSRQLQYFDAEICSKPTNTSNMGHEGQACLYLIDANLGIGTKCVQEYIIRTIYLISNDIPRRLINETISIPSCCSCYYTDYL